MKTYRPLASGAVMLLALGLQTAVAAPENEASQRPAEFGTSVRNDRSAPLPELLNMTRNSPGLSVSAEKPPTFVYPNITENPEQLDRRDRTRVGSADPIRQRGFGANDAPPLLLSFDGIGQGDAAGGGLPPDTNGDVGVDYFVQYINTDWAIYSKTDGTRLTPVMEGNTFWAGFGGICETNNSGDPIVLYDKLAEVWVFSQFTGAGTPAQCFAISDRRDLLDPGVTFFRYEVPFPNGVFNDYPHIGIWTDESGRTSGYYLTTHDFQPNGMGGFNFLQASFSVVERDAMLIGQPADFVRFTNTGAFGASAFGALPAHLESTDLPPAGMCAPFVHNRADLDAYLLWQLCVDWDNTGASTLSNAIQVPANSPFDAGVTPVPQPPPAPAGSELDEFAGNTMYRASARAYPDGSGLPVDLVVNHVANAGDGIGGVRWAQLSLNVTGDEPPANPDVVFFNGFEDPVVQQVFDNPVALEQGLYSPDDDYRWMGSITIDQSGNLGLAYSVSSATTFPSVRYTGREAGDPSGEMRNEQSCVIGSGVQTFVDATGRAGRWGDYSSISIDPVDQCTFWLSVEYVAVTGQANWENRICSFRFPECGNPTFLLRSDSPQQLGICTLDGDPTIDLDLFSLGGFNSDVTLSAVNLPGSAMANFSTNPVNTFPGGSTATLTNLAGAGVTSFSFQIEGSSAAPALTKQLSFDATLSTSIAGAATLVGPGDGTTGVSVRPTLSWNAVADTLSYTIEIATDAGFTNIVETGTSTTTEYTTAGVLDSDTQYFWRVTTQNNCGTGGVSAVRSFTTGQPGECPAGTTANVVFTDDLEGDVSDWTTPADPSGGGNTWAQSGVRFNSGVSSFLAVDSAVTSDQYLVSPPINVPAAGQAPITLSFWNFQNIEANTGNGTDACWDGGLLEVSTDGGNNFTQIPTGDLITDPYNGNITVNAASPISGLDAWCADDASAASGDQEVVSIVDLNQFAGQTIQLRFRLGTDGAVGDEGWYIDDVAVQGCQPTR